MNVSPRFVRNIGILTEEEQHKLLGATVAIVGLGCTGCTITEFLARAGVGAFILVDGDSFEDTNVNRQLYAKSSTLGQLKVEAARGAVLEINPDARVVTHGAFLEQQNAEPLLQSADLVVSGVDDSFAMVVLHRAARALNKTCVFVLSGCLPFQGVCTTIPPDNPVDYETFMGLPTAGKALGNSKYVKRELFEKVTKARVFSALRRGAIPGPWVQARLQGGWVPSFGTTSNITVLLAANEAIKVLICRPGLQAVRAPELIFFDGAACQASVQRPQPGTFWFQGDF